MKKILNHIFYISISLSISCSHLSNSALADYSNVTKIQYDEVNEELIGIDQIINRCDYIRLETEKTNLIGKIDQILFCDSFIVVVDKHIAKSIYVFDNEGHYLNRISRIGNGPGEYLIINHVAINEKSEVCILDNIKERITVFDITGRFVFSQNLPFRSRTFDCLGNDCFIFDVVDCFSLSRNKNVEKSCYAITDVNGRIKYTYGEDHSYKAPSFQSYSDEIFKYDGRVFGRLEHGNTIYEFEQDSVWAKYELSLKNSELYAPTIEDMSTPGLYSEKKLKQPSFSGHYIFCKDYSCYKLMYPEREKLYTWFFLSNKTGKILTLSTESDDLVLSNFYNPLARWGDNTLVQDISPTILLSHKDDIFENSILEKPEALFDGLSLEDNPVLFLYTFNLDKVNKEYE